MVVGDAQFYRIKGGCGSPSYFERQNLLQREILMKNRIHFKYRENTLISQFYELFFTILVTFSLF